MSGERPQLATALVTAISAALIVVGAANSTSAASVATARDVLTNQKGLVEKSGRWVLPLELEMRRELGSLPKLRQEMQKSKAALEQTYRAVVQRNAAAELPLAQLNARLQARLAQDRTGLGAGQLKILDEQIVRERELLDKLRQQWIAPEQFGGFEPLKRQLIKLTNDRNDLATSLLKIQEQRLVVTERYEQLAVDQQVRTALAVLQGATLGPLDDYHARSFLVKLADYERDVFTRELPLYRDNGDLRVSALIGRTPVTFTWRESSETTMLTASVIEATGLEVPADAPQIKHRLADGTEVTVREFDVPYIRFGNHLLRSVKAYALPPEAENVGTQIGISAFEGLTPKAEPQNLRLVLN